MEAIKKAEFKINMGEDRSAMVKILAAAGYVVKIESRQNWPYGNDYYVCVHEEVNA